MPGARPRGQKQQEAGVAARIDAMALGVLELDQGADPAGGDLPRVERRDLDLAGDDDQPGALVDLVVVEALARRQVDEDRARVVVRLEDLGVTRLRVELVPRRISPPGVQRQRCTAGGVWISGLAVPPPTVEGAQVSRVMT